MIKKFFKRLVTPCITAWMWPLHDGYKIHKKTYISLIFLMRDFWDNKSPYTMWLLQCSILLCGWTCNNFKDGWYFLLVFSFTPLNSWISYMDYITLSNRIKNTNKIIPWGVAKQRGLNTQKKEFILIITDPNLLDAVIELSAPNNNKKHIKIEYDTTKTK